MALLDTHSESSSASSRRPPDLLPFSQKLLLNNLTLVRREQPDHFAPMTLKGGPDPPFQQPLSEVKPGIVLSITSPQRSSGPSIPTRHELDVRGGDGSLPLPLPETQ